MLALVALSLNEIINDTVGLSYLVIKIILVNIIL